MGEARAPQLAEANKHPADRALASAPRQQDGDEDFPAFKRRRIAAACRLPPDCKPKGLPWRVWTWRGRSNVEREYRRQYENDRLQGKTDARLRQAPNEGELVAVNRNGDVYRLNPRFVEIDRLERDATGGG